jgi:outer membrane protein FlgP
MKRTTFWALVAATLLTTACALPPSFKTAVPAKAEEPANMITPMTEKRETLVATGYAVISIQNHRNASQQRLLAIRASKLDAYRALTEQVYGQQLDANTTIADMTVMSDTFRARVEGVVYGAVLVSITPVGDDTYETTLSLDRRIVQRLAFALYCATEHQTLIGSFDCLAFRSSLTPTRNSFTEFVPCLAVPLFCLCLCAVG